MGLSDWSSDVCSSDLFSYPWAFGDFVSGQQYDFTTVAMHELLHSFGFMSYVQPSTTATQRNWTLSDSFLQNSGGADLIGADFRFDPNLVASLTGPGELCRASCRDRVCQYVLT